MDNPEPSPVCLRKLEDTITHPEKSFNPKPCRVCSQDFVPEAPSNLYCSASCVEAGADHAYLMRTYGITLKNYQEMLSSQNGRCVICGEAGFKMREHHRKLLVVDHCHESGAVRALLCHNCNRALGLFQDSSSVLRRAASYLETHREGATTIPNGSRSEADADRSAGPLKIKGEDIVWTRRRRRAAS